MDRRVDCLANSLLLARGWGLGDLIEPSLRCIPFLFPSCALRHPQFSSCALDHSHRLWPYFGNSSYVQLNQFLLRPLPAGVCSQECPPPEVSSLSLHIRRQYHRIVPLRCRARGSGSRCDMLAFELGRVSGLRDGGDLGGRRGVRSGRLWGRAWRRRGRGR